MFSNDFYFYSDTDHVVRGHVYNLYKKLFKIHLRLRMSVNEIVRQVTVHVLRFIQLVLTGCQEQSKIPMAHRYFLEYPLDVSANGLEEYCTGHPQAWADDPNILTVAPHGL